MQTVNAFASSGRMSVSAPVSPAGFLKTLFHGGAMVSTLQKEGSGFDFWV